MASQELLVATKNPGKVVEIEELLQTLPYKIVSLSSFPNLLDVDETGLSFVENALIKARSYYQNTSLLCVSDDSGLEVDALGGAPGIYSARYAGEGADDQARYRKLLDELGDLPIERRTARFVCAIALVGQLQNGYFEQTFVGSVTGRILFSPRGDQGFGYDPIFEYQPLSKSFAELSRAEKASISHRGQALAQLREFLSCNL